MTEPQTAAGRSNWEQIHSRLESLMQEQRSRQTDPAAIQEKLARRSRSFRDRLQQNHDSSLTLPVILFTVHGSQHALLLDAVIEVQPLESFSIIPRGPGFLHGVVHFRGMILSLFDLTGLLGNSPSGIADIHFYLVAQGAGHRIAIAAGVVEDLAMIPLDEIKSAPEWGGKIPSHWIRGVYRENCLILDLDAILSDDLITNWNQSPALRE